jgi:hypothetical protein
MLTAKITNYDNFCIILKWLELQKERGMTYLSVEVQTRSSPSRVNTLLTFLCSHAPHFFSNRDWRLTNRKWRLNQNV